MSKDLLRDYPMVCKIQFNDSADGDPLRCPMDRETLMEIDNSYRCRGAGGALTNRQLQGVRGDALQMQTSASAGLGSQLERIGCMMLQLMQNMQRMTS